MRAVRERRRPVDSLAEGAFRRAGRDTLERVGSVRGVVLEISASAACSALVVVLLADWHGSLWIAAAMTFGAGVAGLVLVLIVFGAVAVALAPVRQRNEARDAIREFTVQRAAPLTLAVRAVPEPPVAMPAHGSVEVFVTLSIRSDHPVPIEDVILNFDVPSGCDLERSDANAGPPAGSGRLITGAGSEGRRYWLEREVKLYGGGFANDAHFKLRVHEPGEIALVTRLGVPGFESLTHTAKLTVVRVPA